MGPVIYNSNTTITDTKRRKNRLRSSKEVSLTKYHLLSFHLFIRTITYSRWFAISTAVFFTREHLTALINYIGQTHNDY